MENEQKKLVLIAENVSISEEAKSLNPIFLTIDVKLCDSAVNLNREGVTEAFIADVVNRQGDHLCLPFYADKKNLLAENYEQLGHLYNKVTRKFGTDQIGAMSEFYSDTEDGVVSLYGKIKIPKRDRDIVYRLVDLYEMGRLAVSVELSYNPKELVLKDGGKFIDASENSALTGLCLVWKPACSDAYAMDMVAEAADDSEEIVTGSEELASERGEMEMENEKITAEVTEEAIATEEEKQEETVAEVEETQEAVAEEETVVAENQNEENPEDQSHEDEKENAVAETQETTAEVLEHSVDVHESVEQCPYTDKPIHVIEYRERIIETMEDAEALIAELDTKIAELEEVKTKYDAIMQAEEEKALAEKREHAKAFAEKQGLDVSEVAVAEAIENLDYAKIAELTMAQEQEETPAEEEKAPAVALASFVELDISEDKYGGLLNRRNK